MRSENAITRKELKLTAAVYAKIPGVVAHIRSTGRLPDTIPTGGLHIGANLLIEERGTDITLSAKERLVYDAILRERRLPGGNVILVEGRRRARR